MTELRLDLLDDVRSFAPGEAIEGVISWSYDAPPESVELRLFWYTDGKGDRDIGVHEVLRFDAGRAVDAQAFSFTAPGGPSSFSGKLITISWALEAIARNDRKRAARVELTIAPDRVEVRP